MRAFTLLSLVALWSGGCGGGSRAQCGNGLCETGESAATCCDDCGCTAGKSCESHVCSVTCGNGVCGQGETCDSCAADCACSSDSECIAGSCEKLCGNGTCDSSEDCDSCPRDCGCSTGYQCNAGSCEKLCGNGVCDPSETCGSCAADCGCGAGETCQSGGCVVTEVCGNGICGSGEDETNCCDDCGCLVGYSCRSGSCTYVGTSTMTWNIQDECLNGVSIDARLFDINAILAWPSFSNEYVLAPNGSYAQSITCNTGNAICFGGRQPGASSYWGVDVDGSESCTNCCFYCANTTVAYNPSCP